MIGRPNRTTSMSSRLLSVPVITLAVLAVALSGCGRKGALEPPGTVEAAPVLPTVFGTSPAPPPAPATPPRDRDFILDAII
jgi:predicted small lipoprotein YifL